MVQSTRLKEIPHPLTPLFLVPLIVFLLTIFGIRFYSDYNNRLILEYERFRYDALLEINNKKSELKTYSSKNLTSISSAKKSLNSAKRIVEELLISYDELIKYQNALSDKFVNKARKEEILSNSKTDIAERKRIYDASLKIETKIEALNQYEYLKEIDQCIKRITNLNSQNNCRVLLLKTENLNKLNSSLYIRYKTLVNSTIDKYLSLSKVQRIKKLNEIVDIHNKFTKLLESEINEDLD